MRGVGWCWHHWTRWGDPEDKRVTFHGGQDGVATYQRRTCTKCNKVQEREVVSY